MMVMHAPDRCPQGGEGALRVRDARALEGRLQLGQRLADGAIGRRAAGGGIGEVFLERGEGGLRGGDIALAEGVLESLPILGDRVRARRGGVGGGGGGG